MGDFQNQDTRARGYTLIELAIVLSIMAIIAGIVVPDFIEMANSRMAERMAREVVYLTDSARWWYIANGSVNWPGEGGGCNETAAGVGTDNDLTGSGYVTPAQLFNPWGGAYNVTVDQVAGDCYFIISTCVQDQLAGPFVTYVPFSRCGAALAWCPQNCGAGFDRCCGRVLKPSVVAALSGSIAAGNEDDMCGMAWSNGNLIHSCQGTNPALGCPAGFHQHCGGSGVDIIDGKGTTDFQALVGHPNHRHDMDHFDNTLCFCAHN